MMNVTARLYVLQQIDTKLDRSENRLRELEQAIGNDSDVREVTAALEAAEMETRAARRAHQAIEDDIDMLARKKTAGEKRLYSGSVSNPKELQDLQDESVSLAGRISTLEERQLDAMIAQDESESIETKARKQLEVVRSKWNREQATFVEESSELQATILCLNDERETALIGVSSDLQESYDVVRRHKGGIAVAEVTDNICTVCGMAPSAVRIRQARSGVDPPVKCGNCARIMYVK